MMPGISRCALITVPAGNGSESGTFSGSLHTSCQLPAEVGIYAQQLPSSPGKNAALARIGAVMASTKSTVYDMFATFRFAFSKL